MTPTLLVFASVALGLIAGAAITTAVVYARQLMRRRTEQLRPELPAIATAILSEIDSFAVILDASLTPIYANQAAREQPSVSGEELNDSGFLEQARRVLNTGIPFTKQPILDEPDDTVRIHMVRVPPSFLVVLAEDIAEEQRVNAMRRDFIANVSHELKTPIAAIGLLAEAIQAARDEPEMVQKFAKSLRKESTRLGELSRDIIRLSEAQATLTPADREIVPLYDLVSGEIDALETFATQHGVELILTENDADSAEVTTLGKRSALGVAIANVLVNAIQYSPEGSRVGVGVETSKKFFSVTITDQGPGIESAELQRVFERFYRVDGSRSREGGGTGLGLSITRHTLRAHGGDVEVWSQPGLGSSFTITLPIDRSRETEKAVKRRLKKHQKHGGVAAAPLSTSAIDLGAGATPRGKATLTTDVTPTSTVTASKKEPR